MKDNTKEDTYFKSYCTQEKRCVLIKCIHCSEIEMGVFIDKHPDGFSKRGMMNALGDKFCESAWKRFVSKNHSRVFAKWSYNKEDKKWYYL